MSHSPQLVIDGLKVSINGKEILQMMMLEPRVVLLDEIDSGLDIDALKIVGSGVNSMRSEDRTFLIITHYQRLLLQMSCL